MDTFDIPYNENVLGPLRSSSAGRRFASRQAPILWSTRYTILARKIDLNQTSLLIRVVVNSEASEHTGPLQRTPPLSPLKLGQQVVAFVYFDVSPQVSETKYLQPTDRLLISKHVNCTRPFRHVPAERPSLALEGNTKHSPTQEAVIYGTVAQFFVTEHKDQTLPLLLSANTSNGRCTRPSQSKEKPTTSGDGGKKTIKHHRRQR